MTTAKPSFASRSAMAAPIPRDDPVTMAVFRSGILFSSQCVMPPPRRLVPWRSGSAAEYPVGWRSLASGYVGPWQPSLIGVVSDPHLLHYCDESEQTTPNLSG